MDAEQIRKLLKRIGIAGAFFVLALLLYLLGWRSMLIAYAIVVTVVMVLAILLQSGRGGGLASLGGMGGDNLLGARAATPIAKATYVMGALFLFICMLVSRLSQVRPEAGGETLPTGGKATPTEQVEETPSMPAGEAPTDTGEGEPAGGAAPPDAETEEEDKQ
jgi:protein translocase SecG subunit